ncbi:hypothetical protein D3C73_1205110 [compost metagenome]
MGLFQEIGIALYSYYMEINRTKQFNQVIDKIAACDLLPQRLAGLADDNLRHSTFPGGVHDNFCCFLPQTFPDQKFSPGFLCECLPPGDILLLLMVVLIILG